MRDAEGAGGWPPEGLVRQPQITGLRGASGGLGADVDFKKAGWLQPVWTRRKPLYLETKDAGTVGRGVQLPLHSRDGGGAAGRDGLAAPGGREAMGPYSRCCFQGCGGLHVATGKSPELKPDACLDEEVPASAPVGRNGC